MIEKRTSTLHERRKRLVLGFFFCLDYCSSCGPEVSTGNLDQVRLEDHS